MTEIHAFDLSPAYSSPSFEQSYDGRTSSGKIRRMTSDDAAQQRRKDHERLSDHERLRDHDRLNHHDERNQQSIERGDSERPSLASRTWKRLSVMSRSPSPSPSAVSANASISTASKTFSHHSAAPILSPVPPRIPNKLVKRTDSTLRRPATSHQRDSLPSQRDSSVRDPLHNQSWRGYFGIKRGQKRYATHDGVTLRELETKFSIQGLLRRTSTKLKRDDKPSSLSNSPNLSHLSNSPNLSLSHPSNLRSSITSEPPTLVEDDTDQSTLFDSLRTRGTRSTSGAYRARIETIFDESPSASPPKCETTPIRARSIPSDQADDGSPMLRRQTSPPQLSPTLPKALNLGTLEYDQERCDDAKWDESLDWVPRRNDTKNCLFDWSEQADGSACRPQTVHGKKARARPSGRVPSGHARSQSVPVAPGLAATRETVMTNKFGTWGVGSKGVSEDWDEDFDFGDRPPSHAQMHIPQTIRESQANVVTNIGLVREFYRLIEQLKILRPQHASSPFWTEVDAMIDLADQEVDDPLFPAQQDPFEPEVRRSRSHRRSVIPTADNDIFQPPDDARRSIPADDIQPPDACRSIPDDIQPPDDARRSVIPDDIFQPPDISPIARRDLDIGRPRQNSEAMARSVIEAVSGKTEAPVKKLPFDTTTLRHIVPYVHGLVGKAQSLSQEDVLNQKMLGMNL